MGDEDDIGGMARDAGGLGDVGAQYVCVDEFGKLQIAEVFRHEHSRLELQ